MMVDSGAPGNYLEINICPLLKECNEDYRMLDVARDNIAGHYVLKGIDIGI